MLDVLEAYEAWCTPARSNGTGQSLRARPPALPSWLAPRPASDLGPPTPEPEEVSIDSAPEPLGDDASFDDLEGPRSEAIPPPPNPVELRDYESELEELRADVVDAVAAAKAHRRAVLAASERDLVSLAIAIAERVVGRELTVDPSFVAQLAREGVDALSAQDELTVAIAPDLAERVPAEAWARALDRTASPVVDATLGAARIEVRGKYGRVDASVSARLDAVARALAEPDE